MLVDLKLDAGKLWPDLKNAGDRVTFVTAENAPLRVNVLDQGSELGLPSLALRVDLPDGRIVVYETTARLFVGIAKALKAKYPSL